MLPPAPCSGFFHLALWTVTAEKSVMDQLVRYDRGSFEVPSEGESHRRWGRRADFGAQTNPSSKRWRRQWRNFRYGLHFLIRNIHTAYCSLTTQRHEGFPQNIVSNGDCSGECTATTAYAFETCQLELGTSALITGGWWGWRGTPLSRPVQRSRM
jgi:hypothetical protein